MENEVLRRRRDGDSELSGPVHNHLVMLYQCNSAATSRNTALNHCAPSGNGKAALWHSPTEPPGSRIPRSSSASSPLPTSRRTASRGATQIASLRNT